MNHTFQANGANPSSERFETSGRPWLARLEKADAVVAREMTAIVVLRNVFVSTREATWHSPVEHSSGTPTAEIQQRLLEGDPALASELVSIVEGSDATDLSVLSEVLWALEVLAISDDILRERLANALYRLAVKLRDDERATARPILWSALRRYSSIVDENRVETLLDFLREQDEAETRQAALHGIQSIFFRSVPAGNVEPLVQRLRALVDVYLRADVLVDSTMRALATNAVVALSVLQPDVSVELATRVRSLGRPGMLALLASKWTEMMDVRDPTTARELRAAIAALKQE